MALTRAFLRGLGIEDSKIESIIEAHSETVTGLQAKISDAENRAGAAGEKAEKLAAVQRELDELKAGDYRAKYEKLSREAERGRTRAAREKAVRAYYEGKQIRGGNLAIAMRGTDLDSIELDEHGALKSTDTLDELVAGDFAPLVGSRRTVASGSSLGGRSGGSGESASEIMNRLLRSC